MDNFFGIVEAFYSRFILRDLLAKITPGAIVLLVVCSNINFDNIVVELLKSSNLIVCILFFSIAWIVGFAIQGIGELLGLIKYHENEEAEKNYHRFLIEGKEDQQKDVERMVVIKETCGNSYVALLMVLVITLTNKILNNNWLVKGDIINYIMLLIFIISLRYMHNEHVKRQNKVVKAKLINNVKLK